MHAHTFIFKFSCLLSLVGTYLEECLIHIRVCICVYCVLLTYLFYTDVSQDRRPGQVSGGWCCDSCYCSKEHVKNHCACAGRTEHQQEPGRVGHGRQHRRLQRTRCKHRHRHIYSHRPGVLLFWFSLTKHSAHIYSHRPGMLLFWFSLTKHSAHIYSHRPGVLLFSLSLTKHSAHIYQSVYCTGSVAWGMG